MNHFHPKPDINMSEQVETHMALTPHFVHVCIPEAEAWAILQALLAAPACKAVVTDCLGNLVIAMRG